MAYTGKQGGYRPQTTEKQWTNKETSRPAPVASVAPVRTENRTNAGAVTNMSNDGDTSYLVSTFLSSKKVENQYYTRVDERTLENLQKISLGDMIIFGLSKKADAKFPAYIKVLPKQ